MASKSGTHVEVRSKPHLDVAYTLVDVVPCELVGHPLQTFCILKDRTGVGEALEVVTKAGVGGFEDQFFQPFRGVGGKLHSLRLGQLN